MPPPWLAYPEIERNSIGWRMGCGENYLGRFSIWLDTLSTEELAKYQLLFPEPIVWKGWWMDESNDYEFVHGCFCIQQWSMDGIPKYNIPKLAQEVLSGNKLDMCLFWGHQPDPSGNVTKSCFSQWWMSEFWSIAYNYCCMEQFMMSQKSELFEDKEIQQQILASKKPNQIKLLGKKVNGFEQEVWDNARYAIVLNGNWCKFSQNQKLKKFLLSTGNSILVEASPYDAIWGIQLDSNSPDTQNPMKWKGQNLLGFALMEVRDELFRVTQNESLCDWNTVE